MIEGLGNDFSELDLSHGFLMITGITGAGKTLLAAEIARQRTRGEWGLDRCACTKVGCRERWGLYTNMEKSVERGYARRLRLKSDPPPEHSVLLIDEIYLELDSREYRLNGELLRVLYQSRKDAYLVIGTSPTLDAIDLRARDIVRVAVETWSPVEGYEVHGVVLAGQDARIPPWARNERRWIAEWDIGEEARDMFDTREPIMGRTVMS